jgi:ribosomal protein L11 methyltransferase
VGPSEIKAEISPSDVERVDGALLEAGCVNWSVLEDVIAQRAWIVGICGGDQDPDHAWRDVRDILASANVALRGEPVRRALADEDWRHSYKAHFRAWQFDRLHWVPIWEKETFVLPPGDAVLWLDPGLAFGTGNHETTRLCVERLVAIATAFGVRSLEFGDQQSIVPSGESTSTPSPKPQTPNRGSLCDARVVDAGCGSGILALSAVLLGFRDVRGFDNDPEAVRISEENAALNGLQGRVRFETADLAQGLAHEHGTVDILLANIQADVLVRFASELIKAVAPGGSLVLSGILAGENSAVRLAFEKQAPNWTVNARVMGEWSDIVLVRAPT